MEQDILPALLQLCGAQSSREVGSIIVKFNGHFPDIQHTRCFTDRTIFCTMSAHSYAELEQPPSLLPLCFPLEQQLPLRVEEPSSLDFVIICHKCQHSCHDRFINEGVSPKLDWLKKPRGHGSSFSFSKVQE